MNEKNNYKGEMFLDKLYKDLYFSNEVQHTKKNKDSKYESIKKYMDRLERIHKGANIFDKKSLLKNFYYKKYVIDEINLPDNFSNDEIKKIINNQKKSLDKWIDYLSDENSLYPTWAKYWVFQGILKIGTYDEVGDSYKKRSKKTIAPFIEIYPEIVSQCISMIQKQLNNEEINDKELEELVNSGSFQKLYTALIKKYKKYVLNNLNDNDGIWAEFYQGSIEDAKILSDSLQDKYTGWCTADESMAKAQICGGKVNGIDYKGGDFYVYYTKDDEGNYTIPRVAIRMNGKDKIAEIRGVDDAQNIEKSMINIVRKKIIDMPFLSLDDVKKYTNKINDLEELKTIFNKTINNEKLSDEELHDLYEKNFGFGFQNDPLAIKLIQKRCFSDYELFNSIEDKEKMVYKYYCLNPILPDTFKVKEKEVIEMVLAHTHDVSIADDMFKKDKDFILKNIKKDYSIVNWMDDSLKINKEFLIKLFKINIHSLFFFDSPLKNEKSFALELVSTIPQALDYLNDFKNKKEFLLQVFKNNSNVLDFADKNLNKDKNFILKLVRINKDKGIQFANEYLKYDDNFVLNLVKIDKSLFDFADDNLKNNKKFIISALEINNKVFSNLDTKFKHDPVIISNYFISVIKEKISNNFLIDKVKLNLRVLKDIFKKKLKLYNGSFPIIEEEKDLNKKRI